MGTFVEHLRCDHCGKFISEPFDSYTPFGNSYDIEPPDPVLMCRKCTILEYYRYKKIGRMPNHWHTANYEIILANDLGYVWHINKRWIKEKEDKMENLLLKHFEEELVPRMKVQIISDNERWGDTWKHRTVDGQEERMFARITDYFDQFRHAGTPIPWKKIIGECNIAMAREAHPEWMENTEN